MQRMGSIPILCCLTQHPIDAMLQFDDKRKRHYANVDASVNGPLYRAVPDVAVDDVRTTYVIQKHVDDIRDGIWMT